MAATFPLTIVSPAKAVFRGDVSQVEIPGKEGDFGVLPDHAPLLGLIRPGVIHVHGEQDLRFFVNSGYVEVSPAGTTILSDGIEELSKVDPDKAQTSLDEAHKAVDAAESDEEKLAAQKRLTAAQALIDALKAA